MAVRRHIQKVMYVLVDLIIFSELLVKDILGTVARNFLKKIYRRNAMTSDEPPTKSQVWTNGTVVLHVVGMTL